MKISSTALALFCIAAGTTGTGTDIIMMTEAFVVRPATTRILPITVGGGGRSPTIGPLHYIKEGYDTGIGPDVLGQQDRRRRSRQPKSNEELFEEQERQQREDSKKGGFHNRRNNFHSTNQNNANSNASVQIPPDDLSYKGRNDDGIIDAVIVEEFHDNGKTETVTTNMESSQDEVVDGNPSTTVFNLDNAKDSNIRDRLKEKISSTSPSDLFPDLVGDTTGTKNNHHHSSDNVVELEQKTATKVKAPKNTSTSIPDSVWDTSLPKNIQSGSLRTWSMEVPEVDQAQVLIRSTGGNSVRAQLDVWDGPGGSPMKVFVYSRDGTTHPFSCIIPTPGLTKQSISIKNKSSSSTSADGGSIDAIVTADVESVREQIQNRNQNSQHRQQPSSSSYKQQSRHQPSTYGGGGYTNMYGTVDPTVTSARKRSTAATSTATTTTSSASSLKGLGSLVGNLRNLGDVRQIDGTSPYFEDEGSEEKFVIEPNVDSVQVLIETVDHRPCQARIELTTTTADDDNDEDEVLQQVIELGIEDGKEYPFFAVLNTPTTATTKTTTIVRVVNLDKYSAFPLRACVEPYTIVNIDGDEEEANAEEEEHHTTKSTKNHSNDFITDNECSEDYEVNEEEEYLIDDNNDDDDELMIADFTTIPVGDVADEDWKETYFMSRGLVDKPSVVYNDIY